MGLILHKWLMIGFVWSMPLLSGGINQNETSSNNVNSVQENIQVDSFHPYYVSAFEFNHNSKSQVLEITIKIFTDDLENVLKTNFNTPVDFSNEAQTEKTGKMLGEYINKKLQLTADGKKLNLNLLGFEKETEAVYIYMEVLNIPSIKKLDVKNSMLYDVFKEQANIMHVIANGKRVSSKLDNPKVDVSFDL